MSPQYPIQKHQSPQPIAAVLMWLKWSLLSEQLFQLLRQVLFALVQNQMAVRCIRRNAAAVLSCMASYGGLCISILLHICRIFSDIAGTMAAAKGTATIECREKREKSDDMALSVVFNECCYG